MEYLQQSSMEVPTIYICLAAVGLAIVVFVFNYIVTRRKKDGDPPDI